MAMKAKTKAAETVIPKVVPNVTPDMVTITKANSNPVRVSVGGRRVEMWIGVPAQVSPEIVEVLGNASDVTFIVTKG